MLADTAGLRDSADPIEREGLFRARRRAAEADIRLFVFDACHPAEAQGAAVWPASETILVANKIDLLPNGRGALPGGALLVSALTDDGIDALLSALGAAVAEGYRSAAPVLTRARHREALEEAAAALARARAMPFAELRAEDLRLAWRSLGRITGKVDVEDLLEVIFRDFCIGK